jgi:hypothetical protein
MKWNDLPLKPEDRTLRQFAGLWTMVFSGIAVVRFASHDPALISGGLLLAALLVGVPGLFRPGWVRPIFVGWIVAVFPIGWCLSHLLLAFCYFGLFTPLGLIFQLIGRDELNLRTTTNIGSFWQPRRQPADAASYYGQF